MLSIICVTYNSENHIQRFLSSVKATSPADAEVIIVDNSGKNYGLPFVKVNQEGSYPSGLNDGIAMATKPVLLCCNPDVVLQKNWADRAIGALGERTIVGPTSNFCSGVQGLKLPSQVTSVNVRFLIGFCFAISKSSYGEIGRFDEQFVYEQDDLDYSIRARRLGYDLVVDATWFVEHVGHSSALTDPSAFNDKRWLSLYRMFKKHPGADFRLELGGGWNRDWLTTVAEKYPDIKGIESYRRVFV